MYEAMKASCTASTPMTRRAARVLTASLTSRRNPVPGSRSSPPPRVVLVMAPTLDGRARTRSRAGPNG